MRKHPIVEFIKFIIMIFICCTTENPVVIVVFFVTSLIISGFKLWFSTLWMFFIVFTIDIFTISEGVTHLGYRNFHLITMEGIVYGFFMALRLVALINVSWTMSKDIKSDKLVIITSYLAPPIALLISMTIRAMCRYTDKYKEIFFFHKSMEKDDWLHRVYCAVISLSILLDWALENGIETGMSMENRKYGTGPRTSYRNVRISKNDILEIAVIILIFIIYVISQPRVYLLPEIEINISVVNTLMVILLCGYSVYEEINENRIRRDSL